MNYKRIFVMIILLMNEASGANINDKTTRTNSLRDLSERKQYINPNYV